LYDLARNRSTFAIQQLLQRKRGLIPAAGRPAFAMPIAG